MNESCHVCLYSNGLKEGNAKGDFFPLGRGGKRPLGYIGLIPVHKHPARIRPIYSFAAEFLMPADGIFQFVRALGKGAASRTQVAVFDEAEAIQVEQRATPGSQDIQLYDVALLSHHYGVSRSAMIYRLKNLRLIDESEFQRMIAQEQTGEGRQIAEFLQVAEYANCPISPDDFKRRFLGLALEAYRREEITRSKLNELALMVGIERAGIGRALASAGLD